MARTQFNLHMIFFVTRPFPCKPKLFNYWIIGLVIKETQS